MRNKLFLVIAATLVSTSLYAKDVTFDSMDDNGDGKISKDEFHGNIADAGTFSQYDKDGDGSLTIDEFFHTGYDNGLYGDWDANNDDQLDAYEWGKGSFDYYDDDEDGQWNTDEWDAADKDGFWDL